MDYAERVKPVHSIVYLDDDERDLVACTEAVRPRAVHTTTRVADVVDLVERVQPDLALIDFFLGAQPGYSPDGASRRRRDSLAIAVIRELRQRNPELEIVVVSGGSCDPFRDAVTAAGATGMIHKGIGWKKIIDIVEMDMILVPDRPANPSFALRTHEMIAQTYVDTDFSATKTARKLEIVRSTVYRRLKNAPRK